jgi:poly-gamma-glutamate capsule biosynthesis protein CapA/YwtB (metallophosphatase superfamily)
MLTVFLGGDAMLGRGVDQVLLRPGPRRLYESSVKDAREYVALAAAKNGTVPFPVPSSWVWGDAPGEIARHGARVRIVNLETAVTTRGTPWPGKGIHYRMSPANAAALSDLGVDVCCVANNHVVDWGQQGLHDTLDALDRLHIAHVGAGRSHQDAHGRAIVVVPHSGGRRVFVTGVAGRDCGVPEAWAARGIHPGVALLPSYAVSVADALAARATADRRPGDVVVVSLHWGSNWGASMSADHVRFARRLVDGGVDVVHGHSSHHPRAVERHGRGIILYGCGELVDDYEGIEGHAPFRSDLVPLFFVSFTAFGAPPLLSVTPMRLRRLRLERAGTADRAALRATLAAVSAPFGTVFDDGAEGDFVLRPSPRLRPSGPGAQPRP